MSGDDDAAEIVEAVAEEGAQLVGLGPEAFIRRHLRLEIFLGDAAAGVGQQDDAPDPLGMRGHDGDRDQAAARVAGDMSLVEPQHVHEGEDVRGISVADVDDRVIGQRGLPESPSDRGR